ncbi:MAG TPA: response regulator [Caldimonas sp.]|jgi:DNA-binding response OmpR family regulator
MPFDDHRVKPFIMSLSSEPGGIPAQSVPRRRVALCEPDAPLSRLLSEWLSSAGFEPVPCAACSRGDMALVVADVQTPRVDGAARVAALRERFPGARVLAISGYFIASGATAAARELGADAVLAKPFSRATLIEAVSALV